MRIRTFATLGALLLPALAAAQSDEPAQLEGFDAHGFVLAPNDGDLEDLLITWRAEKQEPFAVSIEGLLEYGFEPLVLYTKQGETTTRTPLVGHLGALNLGAFTAVHERVGIGLSAPLYLASSHDGSVLGPAFGDLRLSVPINLATLGEEDAGAVSFSVVPYGVLPSGPSSRFLGSTTPLGGGLIAATYDLNESFEMSFNLGARTGSGVHFENLTGGPTLTTGVGASYLLTDELALRGELRFDPTLVPAEGEDARFTSQSPGEAYLSARGWIGDNLHWTSGLSTAFTRGAGAAPLRLFAGIGWVTGKDRDRDIDGDGFVDSLDECPDEMETFNQYADDDGCPDALADVRLRVVDPDGNPIPGARVTVDGEQVGQANANGVVRLEDRMPGTTLSAAAEAPKGGYQPGSIDGVTLVEGEQTQQITLDYMPRGLQAIAHDPDGEPVAATVSIQGGPDAGAGPLELGDDGTERTDLTPGDYQLVFEADGFTKVERQVALEPGAQPMVVEVEMQPSVQITEQEVVVLEKIFFEFDKAVIRPVSKKILDEIAKTLQANDHVKKVEVQGHTSYEGSDDYNLDLSQRRAQAVVDALVRRGIDRSRLVAKGYGESQPIASSETAEGRERNRRVEFVILEPAPE